MGTMPGTAKIITIFILALKENVQDVSTSLIKQFKGESNVKTFTLGDGHGPAILKMDSLKLDPHVPSSLHALKKCVSGSHVFAKRR